MFQPVETNVSFPKLEAKILKFWKEQDIYEKSLDKRKRENAERFVFFEGPPTANGMPHPGHCLTRAIKDLFPRYQTMRGKLCERKAGWDTHGLPVEVEVCKELGIHSKEEIEAYGVEPFIHRCQESVWRYMQEWERLTERLGFWIHLDRAYVTYHKSYVESVWWSLKQLFDRDLLYQGHKIVWWWAQGGTALSSGEVGQGYREVADPSVYVKFPLLDDAGNKTDTSLLVWTTTPWTLPSNQFVAVHPKLDYSLIAEDESGEKLIVAAALVEAIASKSKRQFTVVSRMLGRELIGRGYLPPFNFFYLKKSGKRRVWPFNYRHSDTAGSKSGQTVNGGMERVAWRVVQGDFVTVESGTGIVHIAPAFGEDDFEVLKKEQLRFLPGQGPELINAVGPDGKFTSTCKVFKNRWVKDCDKDICRELRQRGLLFHQEQYLHEYPFCWRAEEDPLIQYPRKSWFIRTSQFKEAMLKNNAEINWLPEHIKDGRFGNFLATNVDWALSRERYWGTPLPIWVCEKTGKMEAIASYAELLAKPEVQGTEVWAQAKAKNPQLADDLQVHKPYIDAVTYASPFAAGARMRRVTEVIDCWYDSGAMPFAQWGYPHQGQDEFARNFPADFISEALDQTRGWFYSQLAISTLLFGKKNDSPVPPSPFPLPPSAFPHPFKNCIVLGLMLGEDGQKMSKSKRNYREPNEIFDRYGADALRWYFFANQPPWTSIRYSEQAIKDSIPEFLLRLWNVYSFFVIYANIDGFDPAAALSGDVGDLRRAMLSQANSYRPVEQRDEIDRWILTELQFTVDRVVEHMDKYDNYAACGLITAFVDALSNWYVRRSRNRFWAEDKKDQDKIDAYWTLYECIITTCKMVAPFVPFMAEAMWRNLAVSIFGERVSASVHLCDYPERFSEPERFVPIDQPLRKRMSLVREIVSLGRSARTTSKLKVRQPLSKVEIVLAEHARPHVGWLRDHATLIAEELNVKQVEFPDKADQYVSYTVQCNSKRLGPKLGKQITRLYIALATANPIELLDQLENTGRVKLTHDEYTFDLDRDDLLIRLTAKPGWSAASSAAGVVVLSTVLTSELVDEGLVREVVRIIQTGRKNLVIDFQARIGICIETDSEDVKRAVKANEPFIKEQTLALDLLVTTPGSPEATDFKEINCGASGAAPIPIAMTVTLKSDELGCDLTIYHAKSTD